MPHPQQRRRVGFRFRQRFRGVYFPLTEPGQERLFDLQIEVELPLAALVMKRAGAMRGQVQMEGHADAPITGTYHVDLLTRRVTYEFHFDAEDGRPRRFAGTSEFALKSPVRTLEELVGRTYDRAEEETRVVAKTPLATGLRRFLKTLKTDLAVREA